MPETYWHLTRCDLFGHLSPDELRRLESRSRLRQVKRGEPIYLPADEADGVALLTSGRVKICHITPEGKQSILVFVEPGELFGELALFASDLREEYAEAAESSQIVLIPREDIHTLMQRYPDITIGVTKLIGLRRRRIERRLRNLLFRSNRERLVHLLLELVEQYGHREGVEMELRIKLSHQDLANIIGSTRETVTVVLGQLQNEGRIRIARRRVYILDLKALAAEVNEASPEPPASPLPQHKVSPIGLL